MTRASRTALLLAIGCDGMACGQEHVLLGSLPQREAEPEDAGAMDAATDSGTPGSEADGSLVDATLVDAEEDSAGEALSLEFVVNGIQGVTQARGCIGSCITVQARPRGGRPPYDVAWEDGSRTLVRELCANEATSLSLSLRDQDSPPPLDDAGLFPELGTNFSLHIDPRDCSDAGASTDWDFCFSPRPVASSCPGQVASGREQVFRLPEGLPPAEEPLLQLYIGGLLLPETVRVLASESACASEQDLYTSFGLSFLSQSVGGCMPRLDARYLTVRSTSSSFAVGLFELCQFCR